MNLVVKIPCKPHIKKFLESEYGLQPIILNQRRPNIIFDKLHDLLTRPTRYYRYQMKEEYNAQISFIINSWTLNTAGFAMSEEKVISFNSFIDQIIKERLFILIDALLHLGQYKIKTIIDHYIEHNDLLDAGMNYETLKKAYYRHRKYKSQRSTWEIFDQLSVPKSAA